MPPRVLNLPSPEEALLKLLTAEELRLFLRLARTRNTLRCLAMNLLDVGTLQTLLGRSVNYDVIEEKLKVVDDVLDLVILASPEDMLLW
jgi:hypothetical protein